MFTNSSQRREPARSKRTRAPSPRAVAALAAARRTLRTALTARSGRTRLSELGVTEEQLPPVADAVVHHPLYGNTPEPPSEGELLALLRAAL